MDLNYAIFRSEPINNLNDLAQIGLHNKREKKAYNSNPDIDITKSKDNIEIVPLTDKYVKGFYNLTKEYKKQHDERMKTEREDRKRTYSRMVNESRNVVADELLFTASNKFFQNMTTDDIKEWANTCMEFVYNDLGYTKDQVLHATIHMNEWYLDDLSQNIKKSLKNKREDGLFMGSFAPYGYKRDEEGHKLIIDPVAAEVVRKIFDMYANGYGYHKICVYLNNNNIPTRSEYKRQNGSKFVCCHLDYNCQLWKMDTIRQILTNEGYIGNLVQGKTTHISYKNHKKKQVPKKDWCRIENTHEPIIDMDTWNKVQEIIGTHYKTSQTGQVNYFTRKIYCSCCGKAFMRNVYKVKTEESGRRAYLQCRGRKRFHLCNNDKAIRIDDLEKIILNAINDLLDNYYDYNNLKELYEERCEHNINNNELINALEKEKNDLNKKIDNNKNYYRNLFEEKVNGNLSDDMFQVMSKDYFNEIETMMKRINVIDTEIESLEKVKKKEKKPADDILKKYKHIKKLNKVIMDEFIEKVNIGEYDKINKTRDIEIIWNLEF